MKQPTKTSLRRKLDKVCSEVVRSRGKCERCGKVQNLQTCHIFSRRYLQVRWDLENLLCLCAGCHFWNHQNPIMFTEWVREYYGEDRYEKLKEVYRQIYKPTIDDLQTKLKVLQEMRGNE